MKQSRYDFSYPEVGATKTTIPAGYRVNQITQELGQGSATFQAGVTALRTWQQFQLGWLESHPCNAPIQVGQVVAILSRCCGLWWLNACRMVYVIDEQEPMRRFGFAYGTLPDHAASGEERFLVEWNPTTNLITYDILAFSRLRHPLARLGFPVAHGIQKRFGRDSAAAMKSVCCVQLEASANQ